MIHLRFGGAWLFLGCQSSLAPRTIQRLIRIDSHMKKEMNGDMNATLALIRKAQAGDQDALGEVFARYYNTVRAFVRRRLGKELRLDMDSVDIMQETFLAAVESFDKFEVRYDAGIVHWLSCIAENRIREQARYARAQKRDRRRQRALRFLRDSVAGGSVHMEPAAEITLPGDAAAKNELKAKLNVALDRLKPKYRDVIMHRTYGKASWAEVADLMGQNTEAAARQLHARAMIDLATKMGAATSGGES